MQRSVRRVQVVLAAAVMLASGYLGLARADTPANVAPEVVARNLIVDTLVDDARQKARSELLSPELRVKEGLVLLQLAYQRDNTNTDTLLLLEEAAESAADMAQQKGDAAAADADVAIAKKALWDLLKVDPGHLWAQVKYLDLLTRGLPVEEKLKRFRAVFDNAKDFDAQVRSEVGVRIARLLLERSDAKGAFDVLQQAIALNDVNVGALQELARLMIQNGNAVDQMAVYVKLLRANPYQPDAWILGARLLGASGQHDVATDWLFTGWEQKGHPVDIGPEIAVEMGLANRTIQAADLILQLMKIDYGPNMLKPPGVPGYGYIIKSNGLLPGAADDALLAEARTRYTAVVNAAVPENNKQAADAHTGAVVEAVWFDLFAAPDPKLDVAATRLAELQKTLGDKDPIYQRLTGWYQIRSGKLDDALATLTPLAERDAFAGLGLLRIARLKNDDKTAKELVSKLWDANPAGIAALCVKGEAGRLNMIQPPSPLAKALQQVVKPMPSTLLAAHRNPRDLVLITPELPKRSYAYGEPIVLNIKFVNTTDWPLSVGTNGTINTSVIVGGTLRGLSSVNLGYFATANNPRVFRVERRGTIQEKVRVDQQVLREFFFNNSDSRYTPLRLISVSLNVTTAPVPDQRNAGNWLPGLSGQRVEAGTFDRVSMVPAGSDVIQSLKDMISTLVSKPVNERMLIAGALQNLTYNLPEETKTASTGPATQPDVSLGQIRADAIEALKDQLKSGDPMVQAWLVKWAPITLPATINQAMENIDKAADPVVRVMAFSRELNLLQGKQDEREALGKKFKGLVATETDPLLKQWLDLLSQEAAIIPPAPPPAATGAP